jgi:RNA polymerase sigma-70 factor (ECF subfamily)
VSLDKLNHGKTVSSIIPAGSVSTPESRLLEQERRELLQQAISKLPTHYRLPLILHDMEELSTRHTAEILGIRRGTVRVRLHRARLFLRDRLAGSEPFPALSLPSGTCRKLIAESSLYLDDVLDDTLCLQLEEHFDSCLPCREFLFMLQREVEKCRRLYSAGLRECLPASRRDLLLAKYRAALSSLQGKKP